MDLGRKRTTAQLAVGLAVLLLCLGWMLFNGGRVEAAENVATEDQLNAAINSEKSEINITASFSISTTKTIDFTTVITGNGATLTRFQEESDFEDAMFKVNAGGDLTLSNTILDGYFGDDATAAAIKPLVEVSQEASLFVCDGSILKRNVNVDGTGVVSKGGAICNDGGTVTLEDCEIRDNAAGIEAIGNLGPFPGSGGGIYNTGTLTITDAIISGNIAVGTSKNGSGYGGGIYSNAAGEDKAAGTLEIEKATIEGNTASLGGGGIYVGNNNLDSELDKVPTVPDTTSKFTLTGSTVKSNKVTAAGSVDGNGGLVDSGGGIAVIGNVAAEIKGSNIDNNICNDSTGDSSTTTFGGGGLHIYAYSKTKDTEDGDGRWPDAGSATNINISGTTTIDHNSTNRPGGGMTIQYGAVTLTGDVSVSNNTADGVGGNRGGGGAFLSDGTLTLKEAETPLQGAPKISNNEATKESGGGVCVVSASNPIFTMEAGEISDNTAKVNGGGIYSNKKVNIEGGSINGNHADKDGGGVYSTSGSTFNHSGGTIALNTAGENSVSESEGLPGNGGGVYVSGSTFNLSGGAKIFGNAACVNKKGEGGNGAGVYLDGNTKMNMTGGSIGSQSKDESTNQAFGSGGGVYVGKNSTLSMANGVIGTTADDGEANQASKDGAGVYVATGGELAMTGGTISKNNGSRLGWGTYVSSGATFTMSGGSMVDNTNGYDEYNDLWLAAGDKKESGSIFGAIKIGYADSSDWNKFNLAVEDKKTLAAEASVGINNTTEPPKSNIVANDTAIIENLANTNTDSQFTKKFNTPDGALKVLGNLDSTGAIADGYTLVLADSALPDHLNTDTVLDWSSDKATVFNFLDNSNEKTNYLLSSSIKTVFTQDGNSKALVNEDGYNYDAENGTISLEGKVRDALLNDPLTPGTGRAMTFYMSVLYDEEEKAKYYTTYDTTFSAQGAVYEFAEKSYELSEYTKDYELMVKDFPGDLCDTTGEAKCEFTLTDGDKNFNATFAMGTGDNASNLLITIPNETLKDLANGDYQPVLTVKNKGDGLVYATAKTALEVDWKFVFDPGFPTVTDNTTTATATIKTYIDNASRMSVLVDDKKLRPDEDYTTINSAEGAVKLNLTPAYLQTLANGSHRVAVSFAESFGQAETFLEVMVAKSPTISDQPQGAVYLLGDKAKDISVTATSPDNGALSYQWYQNGNAINGATDKSYTPDISAAGENSYHVVVTNTLTGKNGETSQKSTTSDPAIVKVITAQTPIINTQPLGADYLVDAKATAITVEAVVSDGGSLSYQWYKDGKKISGATTKGYVPATDTAGAFTYHVDVTNTLTMNGVTNTATITSSKAVVNVVNLPKKPVITTQPKGGNYFKDEAAIALTVAAKSSDGGTLSYQWYDQNGPIDGATAVSFTPSTTHVGTMTYHVVVTNTISGGFTASTESDHVQVKTLAPANQPVIVEQPVSASYLTDETPVDLNVTAVVADGGTLSYKWLADGQAVGNDQSYTPPTDTVGSVDYTVEITNKITKEGRESSVSTTSDIATVEVFDHPDPGEPLNFEKSNYYLSDYVKTFDLAAMGTYIRDMESCSLTIDGRVMSPDFYSYVVDGSRMVITLNENVLDEADNGNHTIGLQVVNNAGQAMDTTTTVTVDWKFHFTSQFEVVTDRSETAAATIQTYERNWNRVTDVTVGGVSLAAGEYEVSTSGDSITITLKPSGLAKIPNGTHDLTVTFGNYGSATAMLVVMAAQPPEIITNPTGAEYNRGAQAQALKVTAKSPDGGTLSYQWYKNDEVIDGATDREYTPDTKTAGSADYYVVVTNTINDGTTTSSATAQSAAATIVIHETYPPLITKNLPQLLEPGSGTPSISLEVSAENAVSYQWYKDGQPLTGETGTSLTIAKDGGDGAYYVIVTGTDGTTVQSNICTVKWSKGKGELEIDVETKPGVPNIVLDDSQDLVDGVLTEEEKQKLAEDPEVRYVVTLEAAMLAEDPIALALADEYGLDIGQYLTLTITKQEYYSGELRNSEDVKELFQTIRLIIDVPEEVQKTGRIFKIVRVHNGVAEILEDLDDNPGTITIETRLFSTYAIAYTDTTPVAPAFTSAAHTAVVHGNGGTYQVTASGTAPLLFKLINAPAGVTIDKSSGLMTIAPELAVGTYSFEITVANMAGEATQGFTLNVVEPGSGPSPATGSNAKTGDNANLGILALLMLMALAGVGVTATRLKTEKK